MVDIATVAPEPDEDILPEWLLDDEETEPDDDSGRYAGRPAPLAQSG